MGMDWTCHPQRAEQHHSHTPTLHTRRKTQVGMTQEHLELYCGRGAQDPTAYLGNHSEAGPEQTGVAILCCCPTCLTAFMGMSECVWVKQVLLQFRTPAVAEKWILSVIQLDMSFCSPSLPELMLSNWCALTISYTSAPAVLQCSSFAVDTCQNLLCKLDDCGTAEV